jgi:hypothetical protein
MRDVDPDDIDSTDPQHTVTADEQHQWEATHVYGDVVAITRQFILHAEDDAEAFLRQTTRYDDGEGNELEHTETTWGVTADGGDPKQWSVDHSGETVETFAENAHYADPVVDIEQALRHAAAE